jgi:succinate dehydrogenase/fumarate reductase flavoprotein subunit
VEYDVIIVGGGGSGLAAAVSAAQNGAAVLLLEKQPQVGGTTRISVGSYTASQTVLQVRARIKDSLEAHVRDAVLFAPPEIEERNNSELRRWFLANSSDTLDWLILMGLRFQGPYREPPNRSPRMHSVIPGARSYITVLHNQFMRSGGTLMTNTPVVRLLQTGTRVEGVVTERYGMEIEFRARHAVVLAAGDYASSQDMIARYKGSGYTDIEGVNPDSCGDGHLLAESVGAQLVNMDIACGPELRFIAPASGTFQQPFPARGLLLSLMGGFIRLLPGPVYNFIFRSMLVTWLHPESGLFNDGAILINTEGKRFCDETVSPERELALARQPDKIGYILIDSRLVEKYSKWPYFISTAPRLVYAYVEDYLKLRPDVAVKAGTLAEVARLRNIPPEVLESTVKETNRQRREAGQELLESAPWVLLGPAKAYFSTTEGGVAINRRLEVLDQYGRPIPGLYAVGQNGLGGQILWGHGLHIAWAMTSGRLFGKILTEKIRQQYSKRKTR